ncbi:MAG TPA: metallophosphoesterase [Actinomycetota bacterium]|jgi:Icc-related predicted phosphoesterase
MRIKLISDLHGAVEHLREAARDCDALLVLGDLINVIDYLKMDGILVDVFGREPVAEAAALRARGRYAEARAAMRRGATDRAEIQGRYVELARAQYQRVFDAFPDNTFLTYGNVDLPDLLRSFLRPGVRFLDGEAVDLDGERFGLVGGGIRTPMDVPGEVDDATFTRKLRRMGPVDVVCTHAPPRIPWMVYDVLGRRFEPASAGLLAYLREHRPRRAYHGHVHQPLVGRARIGDTEVINVGHFRGTGRAFVHDTDRKEEPRGPDRGHP